MQDWGLLGHKSDLADLISASTRIHREALEDPAAIINFSIAQRMSWAADRQTTVIEDMAYCLLGIFNINMSMLYGQGYGAFQKLQHEIIKISDDQSIFAWAMDDDDRVAWNGALATSPGSFRNCGSIVRDRESMRDPYSRTNIGLKMRIPMITNSSSTQSFIGLGCFLELKGEESVGGLVKTSRRLIRVWIPVRKRRLGGPYERIHSPSSHVYIQKSYPASKVLDSPEIILRESPVHPSSGPEMALGENRPDRTGIIVAVGFGNMNIVSNAYKDLWHPRNFQVIPLGVREPGNLSHKIIASGSHGVVLSVLWDEHCKPRMQKHTTLHDINMTHILTTLCSQLQIEGQSRRGSGDDDDRVHESIRSHYQEAIAAVHSNDAPIIIVEDEPLYDMHRSPFVMVDIVFKEKSLSAGDHKHIPQDFLSS